jgi:microsomal epoxide hydrolase
MIKPFKLNIPEKTLQEIYTKVKNYPWHEMPEDGGWKYGSNLDYMKKKFLSVLRI